MKHIIKISTITILILILFSASITTLNAQLTHRGFARTHIGALTNDDGDYSVLQNTFDWRIGYNKGDASLFINPVFNYDGLNNNLDISLRQLYFDIASDNFDLRIGKQQIIWGKADGVFITDIISPRDLSQFILPEFEEVRIGVNSIKFDYYLDNSTIEAVWIPIFQGTIAPDNNSIWAPKMASFPINPTINDTEEVENNLAGSEAALKYSYLGSAVDIELMTAYMWDDNPAMHIYPQVDPNTGQPVAINITPKYHRLPLVGASFGKSLFGAVIRGEGAYYFGKQFSAGSISAPQDFPEEGLLEKDYTNYLIGYDHNWLGVNVSLQFIQEYILDYEEIIGNDEFSSTATFLASKTFLNETLELSIFSYFGINNEDMLLRPKISYDFADGFNILFGYDIFIGDEEGNFGQYDDNDMVYFKVRYDF